MPGLGRLVNGLWPARPAQPARLRPPRAGDVDISVVVPLYNHAGYIAEALRSALAQTAPPVDIVVIDDGSTDDGRQVAEAMLRELPGCQVLTQANSGAHATLNRAVALCRGCYIAVLNSDDQFLPRKLEYAQEYIAADQRVDLIAGRVSLIDARGAPQAKGPAADWLVRAHNFASGSGLDRLALLNENYVATTSNMVFSRSLWQAVGGFSPLRYCHDLDFLMCAFDHGRVVLDHEREHIQYRVHGGNTIGEDGFAIRVELAAVIAATLRDSGSTLLGGDDNGFAAFQAFLRNKDISDLTLYLATLRDRFATRAGFFAYVTEEPNRARFAAHLRSRMA